MKFANSYLRLLAGTFLLLGCLAASGCGYHFAGEKRPFPPEVKGVAIPVFANMTSETGFESYLTNQLVYQFSSRKQLAVTDVATADIIVKGKILSEALTDVAFTSSYYGVQRRITVNLAASLETRDGKTLWRDDNISREETYRVESSPISTEANKQTALRKIATDLAEMVYLRISEDF